MSTGKVSELLFYEYGISGDFEIIYWKMLIFHYGDRILLFVNTV
jgi:hypothetical protein